MKDGWIKTAACSPEITVANVQANENAIKDMMREAAAEGAQLIVFPELCLTGYTCGDLFLQQSLLNAAEAALLSLAESTKELDALVFVGVPLVYEGKLYDTAAALHRGQILGVIPKRNLPNYNEFYEKRYFSPGEDPCREDAGFYSPVRRCRSLPSEQRSVRTCGRRCRPEPGRLLRAQRLW